MRDLPGAGKVRVDHRAGRQRLLDSTRRGRHPAHRQANDDAEVKSIEASKLPIRRAYTIEVIEKGELVERQRDLLKVNDILLFGPPNASPMAREVVGRGDVVSLRSTRFEQVSEK